VDRGLYEAAEVKARMARAGLWSDPDPMPPWDWRHRWSSERFRSATIRA